MDYRESQPHPPLLSLPASRIVKFDTARAEVNIHELHEPSHGATI